MHKQSLSCFALVVAAFSISSTAPASTIYIASTDTQSQQVSARIYTVDQTTAAATLVGSNPNRQIYALTGDSRQGSFRLWAIDDEGLSSGPKLVQINPANGLETIINSLSVKFSSIAFDRTSDQLYGVQFDGTSLYRIDPNTAAITFVAQTTFKLREIGFDLSGNLYGFGPAPVLSLQKVDKSTGVSSVVGPIDSQPPIIQGFAARPEDGVMFVTGDSVPGSLATIDLTTGHVSFIGYYTPPTVEFVNGLAFSPAVPEPSAHMLFLLGIACICCICGPQRPTRNT